MKVFTAVLDFIVLVLQESQIQNVQPLHKLLYETREHHLLFHAEVGDYIQKELYSRGVRLLTIHQMSRPNHLMRPEDIPIHEEIAKWFSGQTRVAELMFLPYMDFREP